MAFNESIPKQPSSLEFKPLPEPKDLAVELSADADNDMIWEIPATTAFASIISNQEH
jgi:hypothetical protein